MAKNHSVTKRNRRPVSGKRKDTQRIADTMRKLKVHAAADPIQQEMRIMAELDVLAQKKDEDIDTSDIPEVTDWSNAEVGKFYRPSIGQTKDGVRFRRAEEHKSEF